MNIIRNSEYSFCQTRVKVFLDLPDNYKSNLQLNIGKTLMPYFCPGTENGKYVNVSHS